MKKSIQLVLLYLILFLQLIFLWVSFNKKAPISIESILTIVGWFAVYYFGFRQSKNKISLDKKVEIYDRLTTLKQSLDDKFIFELLTYVSHFRVYEKTIINNQTKKLLIYSERLGDYSFSSHRAYQKFDYCVRTWIFLMPKLEKIEVILTKEFYDFLEKTNKLKESIRDYAINFNKDDRIKKGEIIENIVKDIESNSSDIVNFVDDYIELISDELTFPIFRHRMRRGIENLKEGQLYKKLTKDGIENIPYKLKDFQRNKDQI